MYGIINMNTSNDYLLGMQKIAPAYMKKHVSS